MFNARTKKASITLLVTCSAILLVFLCSHTTAEAVVTARGEITLNWEASSAPDWTGYNIMRSLKAGGPYRKINDSQLAVQSFTDDSVKDMDTYYYIVTVCDAAGNESALDFNNESESVIVDFAADPNGDVDGDGIPNGWENDNGLDPRDASDADADNDNDGLTNATEYALGTDPLNADTDGDGIADAEDNDPTLAELDTDNDGIFDIYEDEDADGIVDFNETDPLNADTDGDGIQDGDEDTNLNGYVDAGETDPRMIDTDRDGLLDGDEIDTDPLMFDTDNDGIADGLDIAPTNPDVNGDTDGDGAADVADDAPTDSSVYVIDNDIHETNDDATNAINVDVTVDARIAQNDTDFFQFNTTDVAAGASMMIEVWAGIGDRIDVYMYRGDTDELVDAALFVQKRSLDLQLAGTDTTIVPSAVMNFPADLVAAGIPAIVEIKASFIGNDGDNRFGGTQDYTLRANEPAGDDASIDTDGDGLTDCQEYYLHTDRELVDTDFDGLNDNDEMLTGCEPVNADTDNDGLLDGEDVSPLGFGGNQAPIAVATAEPIVVLADENVAMRATDSYDPDGDTLTFTWDFGDGAQGEGAYVDHAYATAGTYTVTLTADDGNGAVDTDTVVIEVQATPTIDIVTITQCKFAKGKLSMTATSSASTDGAGLTVEISGFDSVWDMKYFKNALIYRRTMIVQTAGGATVTVTSSHGGVATAVIN